MMFIRKIHHMLVFNITELHGSIELLSSTTLGCPKITPSVKCLAPEAFSGAKLQVFMENGQKNEID